MGIRAYALIGFFIISLLFTQYAFAQFAGCEPNEVRNIEGECVYAFDDEPAEIGMKVSVNAFEGSTTISVSGHSSVKNNDITIMIQAPNGDTVAVYQVSPDANGDFMKDVQIGGSQWELNGFYFVSVVQGSRSLYSFTFPVEIVNGYTRATSLTQSTLQVITPLTVSTDRTSYKSGDTIHVTVHTENTDFDVTIIVTAPKGNIISVNAFTPNYSGTFAIELSTSSTLWRSTGTYSITVQQGTENHATMTFYFVGTTDTGTTSSIVVEGFELGYQITGGNILSITVDEDIRSLIIAISTTDNGELTITLPREIIDAKVGDSDDDFFVLVDAEEVDYDETKTNTDRTLTIYFPYRSSEIEIFGTFVIGSGGGTTPTPTPFDTTPPLILIPSDMTIDATDSSGARVDYSVKAIDDNDGVLRPNCSPSSGSLFFIGETTVTCSTTDNSGNSARKSFLITVNSPDVIIPSWVRDVAGFWCGDEINDSSFIEAIQYLINNDVIIVPATAPSGYGSQEIPSWIKNNACWWSQGLISNSDFASGLQYLIGQGIIRI